MGETFVRSPWNREVGNTNAERRVGTSPLSTARNDAGHRVRSPGKGGGPASTSRRDNSNVPVQGGLRSPYDPRD
jgi:hypothetical protein